MVTGKGGHGAVPRHSCDITLPQRHNFRHGMDALVSSLRRGDWKEKSWSRLRAGKEEGEPGVEGRELESWVSEGAGLASHCGAGLL